MINIETRLIWVSWEEFDRLQQDSDIFTGQIIEKDEEFEEIWHQVEQKKIKEKNWERNFNNEIKTH